LFQYFVTNISGNIRSEDKAAAVNAAMVVYCTAKSDINSSSASSSTFNTTWTNELDNFRLIVEHMLDSYNQDDGRNLIGKRICINVLEMLELVGKNDFSLFSVDSSHAFSGGYGISEIKREENNIIKMENSAFEVLLSGYLKEKGKMKSENDEKKLNVEPYQLPIVSISSTSSSFPNSTIGPEKNFSRSESTNSSSSGGYSRLGRSDKHDHNDRNETDENEKRRHVTFEFLMESMTHSRWSSTGYSQTKNQIEDKGKLLFKGLHS
jgi:hypothetical protein